MKTSTLILASAIAAAAVPAWAQTAATPAPMPANVRVQVRTMENVFVTAVRSGVELIAQKVTESVPGMTVVGGVPHAHGYAVENHGWFFDVEVPELYWSTINLYTQLQRPGPQRPVGNTGQGGATIIAAQAEPQVTRDDYRRVIREALMDAMLDYGQVPLKPNEWLTVGARSADSPAPSMEDTVALVMQITGEDLTLFRQAKISRDEAKKRIKVKEEQR
ncbi:MAG: hypothetical protein EPO35_13250 [Acidobacteria bacterium]|nr:MAG: hypothetical protein EPO35_13250 [Acidobacteriota bacterium]